MGLLGPAPALDRGQCQAVRGQEFRQEMGRSQRLPIPAHSPRPSKEASKQPARQTGLTAHRPLLCWGLHGMEGFMSLCGPHSHSANKQSSSS